MTAYSARFHGRRIAAGCVVLLLLTLASTASASNPRRIENAVTVEAYARHLARTAWRVAPGGALRVEGVQLAGRRSPSTLKLERFAVWAPDATVVVDGRRRPVPNTRYFHGSVKGQPGSVALLMVSGSGRIAGLVEMQGAHWVLRKSSLHAELNSFRADRVGFHRPFMCSTDSLRRARAPQRSSSTRRSQATWAPRAAPSTGPARHAVAAGQPVPANSQSGEPYLATVAIETDYEYYALFGDETAALNYLGLIIGYGDIVYSREIDTSLQIGFARLWTQGASADPWDVTSNPNDALDHFTTYWNQHMQGVERAFAFFLSGKNLGGGIAWVGSLCGNYIFPGSSHDYGVTANINGAFNWSGNTGSNPAAVVWDIYGVLHEMGHTFGASHTHNTCALGGVGKPVDRCRDGCAGPGQGLPACSSASPHFNGGAGTIMSYCHLVGGYDAISLTYGEGHTCGILPDRVPDDMSDLVASMAAAYPACLVNTAPALSVHRIGSGSGTVTSQPAGIHCGESCSAAFGTGTAVTLTATAARGSHFAGWGGPLCSGTGPCVVTMDQSRRVTATFDGVACQADGYENPTDDACYGSHLSASQQHTLCDADWVYFHAAAGATYRIETSDLWGGADTTLSVHPDCGSEIAFSDDYAGPGLTSRIEITPSADGQLDVRISSYDGRYGEAKGYTVSVQCIANCECPATLFLSGQTVATTEAFKASQAITAGNGFHIAGSGDVTFQTGGGITLAGGFSVGVGATFTAIPGLAPVCSP